MLPIKFGRVMLPLLKVYPKFYFLRFCGRYKRVWRFLRGLLFGKNSGKVMVPFLAIGFHYGSTAPKLDAIAQATDNDRMSITALVAATL